MHTHIYGCMYTYVNLRYTTPIRVYAPLGRYLKEGTEDQSTVSPRCSWRETRLGFVNGGLFSSYRGLRV